MSEYLIWSNEHRRWWKPGEVGYTTVTHLAGRYAKAHADQICERANGHLPEGAMPNEVALLAPDEAWALEEFTFAALSGALR
jgi:hypothetical protein